MRRTNLCPQCGGLCSPEEVQGLCPHCLRDMLRRMEVQEPERQPQKEAPAYAPNARMLVTRASLSLVALLAMSAPILRAQVVADSATNALSNVTNTFTGDVTVGTNGSFTLLVLSNNALLTNSGNATIGLNSAAKSNEVRLTSASARWQMGGSLLLGVNGAANRLTVSNGGVVQANVGDVGIAPTGSNNVVMVTGSGSLWSNKNELVLGFGSAGNQLVVSNGGVVRNTVGYVGNDASYSNNLAVVT